MTTPLPLFLDEMESPVGTMYLVTDGQGRLRALDFHDYRPRMDRLLARHYGAVSLSPGAAPQTVRDRLEAYFAGEVTAIEGIETHTAGTPFQRQVWQALRTIPAGQTLSYGGLAARIGLAKAVRAVGLANGANPIAIIVPCHRVIGANGTLTGYGGGLDRKRWLLAHEAGQHLPL